MSALTELLDPKAIALDVETGGWEQAITAVGALLTGTGVATDVYTREMIESVQEKGPYVVIAPGFAFAHALQSPRC